MIAASIPPITRNDRARQMYIAPSFLWSTVITSSWSFSNHLLSLSAGRPIGPMIGTDSEDIIVYCGLEFPDHRSVSIYAVTSFSSFAVRFIAGINEPGLISSGFRIQSRRLASVLGAAPEAMVLRVIRRPRLGPKRPSATVP